jgi:DNA repair exonuclease SbcCD ATPase subunit
LFGKPFRKISKKQLVNTINAKGTVVEIEFEIGSNKYVIHRAIKKYGSSPFEIYCNDELLNQPGDSRDYQAMLEDTILKLNYKSFTQIVILGNASFVPFMQLPAAHRREIIEDLLDIKIFSAMNLLLKDKFATNKQALDDTRYKHDLAQEKLSVHTQYLVELQQNKQSQIESNEDIIKDTEGAIEAEQAGIETLKAEIDLLHDKLPAGEKLNAKLSKMDHLKSSLKTKLSRLGKDIQFYEENDHCPTCKQGIDADIAKQNIDQKKTTISDTETALSDLESQYDDVKEALVRYEGILSEINELNIQITQRQSNISAHQSYISKIQKENEKLKASSVDDKETKKNISTLNKAIKILERKKKELLEEQELLDTASELLKDKGIKTRIIKQYVPVMNKLISKYLAAMDFFVNFELDENFEEIIKSRHRDVFTYASFSEGEKMRIDLALLFTWRAIAKMKNSVSTNLLMLDEVFDASLDTGGCDEFLKLLHQQGKDTNVFVISHKGDVLQDKFFSMIKFEKHKDFSRIAA